MRDDLIQRLLDAVDLEAILEFNDIPEYAVIESLIENSYISEDDLLEQLDDYGLAGEEADED